MYVDCVCPHCRSKFTVRQVVLGKRTKCTECGELFTLTEAGGDATGKAAPTVQPPDADLDEVRLPPRFADQAPQKMPLPPASAARAESPEDPPFPPLETPPATPVRPLRTPAAQAVPPPPPPIAEPEEAAPGSDQNERRGGWWESAAHHTRPSFWALRTIARSYEVFAALSGAVALVSLIVSAVRYFQGPTLYGWPGWVYFIFAMLSLSGGLLLAFAAQVIRLLLQIEENTHATAAASRDLAKKKRHGMPASELS